MKIKSNLHAGMTFAECDAQRNYMKQAAQTGNCSALNQPVTNPGFPTQLPSPPPAQQPIGGGYYGGVYYPDRSGWCN